VTEYSRNQRNGFKGGGERTTKTGVKPYGGKKWHVGELIFWQNRLKKYQGGVKEHWKVSGEKTSKKSIPIPEEGGGKGK